MKSTSLLAITHGYHTFQKDSIEACSQHLDEVTVLAAWNPLFGLANFLPISRFRYLRREFRLNTQSLPPNVAVRRTDVFYIPIESQYRELGAKHLASSRKALKQGGTDFDIVHAHFLWSAGYVGRKIKERYAIPLVVTAHGYDVYDLPFRDNAWRDAILTTLKGADAIITVSNSNAKCMEQLGVRDNVSVIPNGFREELFRPLSQDACRHRLNLPRNKRIVLAVGNLVPPKGHANLIDAMMSVAHKRHGILCVIVGDGPLMGRLRRHVVTSGLKDHVILAGGVPHSQIPFWINSCDVLALPSVTEGNPTIMFEALGCGKPVIGTSVGGIPEIINSNLYGRICNPGRPADFAEAIIAGLDTNWRRSEIVNYSRLFTWARVAERVCNVYDSLL